MYYALFFCIYAYSRGLSGKLNYSLNTKIHLNFLPYAHQRQG